ncbi:uncharacterized protein LOC131439053 [Malaya genurostris]|uniref:uncharacterized protein LOC131439053 n=1 Tax=Malaya genurostris TaxID=325434 RepID=UPI0026F406C9|nr:uncharacterized protein LOC131439053 [Malaya genurostris]
MSYDAFDEFSCLEGCDQFNAGIASLCEVQFFGTTSTGYCSEEDFYTSAAGTVFRRDHLSVSESDSDSMSNIKISQIDNTVMTLGGRIANGPADATHLVMTRVTLVKLSIRNVI